MHKSPTTGGVNKDAVPSTGAVPPTTSFGQPSFAHSSANAQPNPRVSTVGERPPAVMPIEGLSPYQNKWTIKARVTQKSEMKHWSNPRGDGKLFNCTFLDNTGEIKATAFNAAADELFDKVREGGVYYVSRARVNVAKKKFSNIPNDYEITLEKTSEIVEVSLCLARQTNDSRSRHSNFGQCHDTVDAPQIRYNFVLLDQMENLQKDTMCGKANQSSFLLPSH
jgi:replication factor A1